MQRTTCHEFAQRNRWTITNEYYKKGISGFKVSASKRDSIWNANKAADIKKDIASVKNAISFSIVLDLLIKTRVDFREAE